MGLAVGSLVGLAVGIVVGFAVGLAVGLTVGSTVGLCEAGDKVGDGVGAGEGIGVVGSGVGSEVGSGVGSGVGSEVAGGAVGSEVLTAGAVVGWAVVGAIGACVVGGLVTKVTPAWLMKPTGVAEPVSRTIPVVPWRSMMPVLADTARSIVESSILTVPALATAVAVTSTLDASKVPVLVMPASDTCGRPAVLVIPMTEIQPALATPVKRPLAMLAVMTPVAAFTASLIATCPAVNNICPALLAP